ncbi:ATP-binding protein [Rhizobium alvei]|uniref:histidine kinase n=1 Tax=Rhizobium alvei TaxID=1132659 RepID=A0ABT8YT14_9HYPH|nr:ATP-binding protein [Rhizobium alvei]MDO6966355.1 ATP-binding protein [Rhizobium alvei]
MSTPEADRIAIRKAGLSTSVLKFFAIGLSVVLGFIYYDISERYTAMQSGIRENAMWSVYQLDREARNLNARLAVMLATKDLSLTSQKQLATRYDILYSRMDMLAKATFEQTFTVNDKLAGLLTDIRRDVFEQVGIFDAINAGEAASTAELQAASADFQKVVVNTEQLVTFTNSSLSADRADQREAVAALEMKSLILIGFLALIIGVIILMLRRQLASVRAAGLSFERMAERLEGAYQAAEAGGRAKSQFMATMSHEIRTPLNAILGTVELMELTQNSPECAKNLRTIRTSGEALLDIINEILDFSKMEHGRIELEMRSVDIRAMAESIVEMIRGRALESGNRISLDAPESLSLPYIRTDVTRLRQVLLNLMSNAAKFTRNGSVTLRISERNEDGTLRMRFDVIDTGIGINEEGRAKLFKPFSQVDASIARKYGGTGLGLTICKEIVEQLGGVIDVESVFGHGSTFWFEIPVEAGQPPKQQNDTNAIATLVPRLNVLIVEDNPINLHVALKFLNHLGQDVVSAENGAIAIEKAEETAFDLILMDMQMPVMDGIEAARRIRAGEGKSRRSPIYALTANASDDDARLCLEAGMDGFQSKPINMNKLRQMIIETAGRLGKTLPAPESTIKHPAQEEPDLTSFQERRAELVEVLGEEDFAELLDSFFTDITSILSDLKKELHSENPQTQDRLLHTIKGAAGNIGLIPIAELAEGMRRKPFGEGEWTELHRTISVCQQALAA